MRRLSSTAATARYAPKKQDDALLAGKLLRN